MKIIQRNYLETPLGLASHSNFLNLLIIPISEDADEATFISNNSRV
jgi:hypothetical protein